MVYSFLKKKKKIVYIYILSLTNGPMKIQDTNLESVPPSRDLYPSIGIGV